jgi:hypothetical protein
MLNLKKDFWMIVYPSMPHGFFSFDTPNGMKECKYTINEAREVL